jgi:hypothetical protein
MEGPKGGTPESRNETCSVSFLPTVSNCSPVVHYLTFSLHLVDSQRHVSLSPSLSLTSSPCPAIFSERLSHVSVGTSVLEDTEEDLEHLVIVLAIVMGANVAIDKCLKLPTGAQGSHEVSSSGCNPRTLILSNDTQWNRGVITPVMKELLLVSIGGVSGFLLFLFRLHFINSVLVRSAAVVYHTQFWRWIIA